MQSPATIQEFVERTRESTVVPQERLDAFFRRQRGRAKKWKGPPDLADALLEDGLLSKFQAKHLLLGRTQGYWIKRCLVLEDLGTGGMGRVFLCEQTPMRRLVAVKVLPSTTPPGSMERFLREARASAALDHPNLVRAFDVDEEARFHFLVLEFVDGPTLQKVIKRSGPLDIARACHYTAQAALGLHHAHVSGWVHRDVKPANLLVDRSGTVKVLDLGLARFALGTDEQLTKQFDDQNLLGTADFIAPEQTLPDHTVDSRVDIYSLGATLFFLLTGQAPFSSGNILQKLMAHRLSDPPPLQQLRPEAPPELAAVVQCMMAKNPAQRFQTAEDVCVALQPFLAGGPFRPTAAEVREYCPRVRLLAESGKAQVLSMPTHALVSSHALAASLSLASPGSGSSGVLASSRISKTFGMSPSSGTLLASNGSTSSEGLAATAVMPFPTSPPAAPKARTPLAPAPSPERATAPARSRGLLVAAIAAAGGVGLLAVLAFVWIGWWLFFSRPADLGPIPGVATKGADLQGKPPRVDQGKGGAAGEFVTPQQAALRIDQRCTVRFLVARAGLSTARKTLFLNSEENYKAENNFTVVIHGIDSDGTKDPNELPAIYEGKTVQVTGLVTLYQGRPQIVAADKSQVRIVSQP